MRYRRLRKGNEKLEIIEGGGEACPRCGGQTQLRRHKAVTPKLLRQPFYYSQWFNCTNPNCKTGLIMLERFKVWNRNEKADRLNRTMAIYRQLAEGKL